MATSIQTASDAELIDMATQCFNAMNANLAAYPGLIQQQVDDLKTAKEAFAPAVTDHVAKQAAAKAQTQAKDAARVRVETLMATLRNISKAGGASEAALAATGIPVVSAKAPANATVPAGSVDTSKRLRHTIHWTDVAGLDNKRRPRGAMGAEIFVKIDGPPPPTFRNALILRPTRQRHTSPNTTAPTPAKWRTACSAGACPTAPPAPGAKPSAPPSRGNVMTTCVSGIIISWRLGSYFAERRSANNKRRTKK